MKSFFNSSDRINTFDMITLRMSGMRFVTEHEIVMRDGTAEVSLYGIRYGQNKDERILEERTVCDQSIVLELLNDCGLLSWDGFHGSHPKCVKDGIMFTLKATVNDGKTIYATGSENFPRHFRDFTDGLYKLLKAE